MREPKNLNRITLGPVARKLIEGHTANRPQALDDAILSLQEASEATPESSEDRPQLEGRTRSMEAMIERQS